MDYATLKYEIRDHVGWLTLNRPEQHNAMSWEMIQELRDFFGSLDDNLDVRVVVIRSAGKNFCTGLDLTTVPGFDVSMAAQGEPAQHFRPQGFMIQRKLSDIAIRMRHAPQPIIASVRGVALGGGFALALASDIRLASETARLSVGAPRIGISAGETGISYFLPRLIGASRAALYMFTSRFIDAATAERIGLVSQIVPDNKLDEATDELVKELLKISPFALRMTKEIFNAGLDSPSLEDTTKVENRTQLLCGLTKDMIESVKANIIEKRTPVYTDD